MRILRAIAVGTGTDPLARQGAGFTDAPVECEEAFSLDACFGDVVHDLTTALVESLVTDDEPE